MKIAILTQAFPPMISGSALFCQSLGRVLSERGHEVLILAASDRSVPYHEMGDHLIIRRLRSYPNPLRVSQRFVLWPDGEIRAALQSFSPEIVHLHDPLQLSLEALAYCERTGVPSLLTIHALPTLAVVHLPKKFRIPQIAETCLWKYAAWLLGRFDALATPTQTTAKIVASHTGKRPQVISGGVDLERFSPQPLSPTEERLLRSRLHIPADAPVIFHAGRLDAGKNAETVVRAAAQAMDATTAHLLIAGDGKHKSHLMKLCRELGVMPRSHFPGYITDQAELSKLYRLSTVFATASEIETQGLVLLEAAACGLPIVAVDSVAVPEIVVDGINGFLISTGDSRQMALRITQIIQDPALSRRFACSSRSASLAHDFDRTADQYDELYHRMVRERKGLKVRLMRVSSISTSDR